ncbi:hypothetical protein BsWGS_14437 [Bradybaena similaris]
MGQAGSKQEMFWEACGYGRAHLVQKFIEHGINVNWVSSIHGHSPIHVASQGKPEVVQLLIGAGCDLTVVDLRGNTAVHHAAMKGHADIIQMLVDAGADINAQDKNGWTPLHCAAYFAHIRAVEVLLRNKCETSILNKDGRSALVETARSKNYGDERVLGEIARRLIEAGSDVNLKCADLGEADFTALMFAAYHNHVDVGRAFVEGGCHLDCASCFTKWTALHWAADCGSAEMVSLLLDAGADPTRTGMRGELPVNRAKSDQTRQVLENAVRAWHQTGRGNRTSWSSTHSFNAQASLDTARALESLSCHAKNRDILAAPMPTMPALCISSRSDPKLRYTRRSVTQVAIKSVNTLFPWKSYSKQASPSPENGNMITYTEVKLEGGKMFPSQDDKTNAFMKTLAERITYMTSQIASMSGAEPVRDTNKHRVGKWKPGPDAVSVSKSSSTDAISVDSGLSTLEGSGIASELSTPDDGVLDLVDNLRQCSSKIVTPRSPNFSMGSSLKTGSLSDHAPLDERVDACIIEANHRGFSILHALQERHRRSVYLGEAALGVPARRNVIIHQSEIMTQV